MKNSNQPETSKQGAAKRTVRIEFSHETAQSVSVAGTFNDWRPGASEMVQVGKGRWLKDLVLPAGRYEYRLVVDGTWIADPSAVDTAPNSFGGLNSVLTVSPDNSDEHSRSC